MELGQLSAGQTQKILIKKTTISGTELRASI